MLKPTNRINLVGEIALCLQEKMKTSEINAFLAYFGINANVSSVASKCVYVKELLNASDVHDTTIIEIAEELELETSSLLYNVSAIGNLKVLLSNSQSLLMCYQDFHRALRNVDTDPSTAIASASSTLESICKAILDLFDQPYPSEEKMQSLLKAVFNVMSLSPDAHADADIKRTLGGLLNAGISIGVLRTKYSMAHGKGIKQGRLQPRHARLAINALSTIGLFLMETYQDRFKHGTVKALESA